MSQRVITANRLHDGAVIWLAQDGVWVEEIDRAEAYADAETAATRLAAAQELESAGRIIAAYDVEVEIKDDSGVRRLVPIRLREKIRAHGPTVASN